MVNVFCPAHVISATNLNYRIYSLAASKDTNEQETNMKITEVTLYLRLLYYPVVNNCTILINNCNHTYYNWMIPINIEVCCGAHFFV